MKGSFWSWISVVEGLAECGIRAMSPGLAPSAGLQPAWRGRASSLALVLM